MSDLKSVVEAVFGPNGWLKENDFRHTDVQLRYALSICDAVEHSKQLHAIAADTGVGKTLAYLVVASLHNIINSKRVVVAAHSIELLRQMEKERPLVEEITRALMGTVPQLEVKIGRQHYIDPERVEMLLDRQKSDGACLTLRHTSFLEWAHKTSMSGTGLISEWLDKYGQFPDGVDMNAICMTSYSNQSSNMASFFINQRTKESGVVLTTHAMVVSSAFSESLGDICDTSFIIDEGDKFDAAAALWGNVKTPIQRIASMAKQCLSDLKGKGGTLFKDVAVLALEFDEYLRRFDHGKDIYFEYAPVEVTDEIKSCTEQLLWAIEKALESTKEQLDNVPSYNEMKMLRDFIRNYQKNLFSIGLHFSEKKRNPALLRHFVKPAALVRKHIEQGANLVFTSATLRDLGTNKESFSSLASKLLISEQEMGVKAVYSPESYGSLRFFVPTDDVPKPYKDGEVDLSWRGYVVETIKYAQKANRHVLVLASSYEEVEALKIRLGGAGFFHTKGESLNSLVDDFKIHGGVLVSPAVWEGFSPRMDDGSQLYTAMVMTKLPYSVANDVKLGALSEMLASKGTHHSANAIYFKEMTQEAMKRFCQGVGRGIRAETDKCDVYVCDSRINHSIKLQKGFAKSLPVRFESNINEAVRFDGKDVVESKALELDALEGWV